MERTRWVWRLRMATVSAAAGLVVGGVAAPAMAADPAPDLQVSAAFDKASYVEGAALAVTVTVRNAGTVTATGISRTGGADQGITWGPDLDTGTPFDLAGGATKTLTWHGTVNHAGAVGGVLLLSWRFEATNGEANPSDNDATARATVTGQTGNLDVLATQVVSDADRPGVPGVEVSLLDPADRTRVLAKGTTDAAGRVSFTGLPTGSVIVHAAPPAGWKLHDANDTAVQILAGHNEASLLLDQVPTSGGGGTAGQPGGGTHPGGGSTLPVTGTDTVLIGGTGAGLVLLGVTLYLLGRRRPARSGR